MNKAVIYVRVSAEGQTEESQIKPCEEFCKQKGYDVIGIYKDHASAYCNVKRKGYDKVIELVKNRKIGHVIVWALDRWTRRGPKDLINTINYLSSYGVHLHSVEERWIDEVTTGELSFVKDTVLNVLGWLAKKESQRLSERVKASKKFQKAKKKGTVGRPGISDSIKKRVIQLLGEGETYSFIEQNVTYKAKYGKIRHVSAPTISEIKKEALGEINERRESSNIC